MYKAIDEEFVRRQEEERTRAIEYEVNKASMVLIKDMIGRKCQIEAAKRTKEAALITASEQVWCKPIFCQIFDSL